MVIKHNDLQNIFTEFCCRAHLAVRVEAGRGLSGVNSNSCPADVLLLMGGKGQNLWPLM